MAGLRHYVLLLTLVYHARQRLIQYSLAKICMYRGITAGRNNADTLLLWNWFSDLFSWQQFCVWQELRLPGFFRRE